MRRYVYNMLIAMVAVMFAISLGLAVGAVGGSGGGGGGSGTGGGRSPHGTTALIDINSASKSQLMSLPGIGDAAATKIIANRPYNSINDLKSRNIITRDLFVKIQLRITARQTVR